MDPFLGLRPIPSRLALDFLTLLSLGVASLSSKALTVSFLVLASWVLTLGTAGLTNRWTIMIPLVPLSVLQALRPIKASFGLGRWATVLITALSVLLVFLATALCILFPAVELPPVQGPYHVGVVDFFLPLQKSSNTTCQAVSHLSVRLYYPTHDEPHKIPYLRPDTAEELCRQNMLFGAPPPLKKLDWILHTWRLARLSATTHAPLATTQETFPVVVFSHGLGGNVDIYAYQTMALAAHGNIVLSINHLDGSALVVPHPNGSLTLYDRGPGKLWFEGREVEYVRIRRARTEHRVQELLAATEAFLDFHVRDPEGVGWEGPSFRGRLQTENVTVMGHSYGGATALSAAKRRPGMIKAIIAYDPAVDWMPDEARRSLFAKPRIDGLPFEFSGGTGGYEDGQNETTDDSIHAFDMLVVFSREWRDQNWGWSHILENFHQEGRLGRLEGLSKYHVIEGAQHVAFSDVCMLAPVWLARATGVTGSRIPHHAAIEIEQMTRSFLDSVYLRN